MASKKQTEESYERDENDIEHLYFDRTPPKSWKLSDALKYYLQQNVPTATVYDVTEESLKKCIDLRDPLKKFCLPLVQELEMMKTIHQSAPSSSTSSRAPLTPVTTDTPASPSSAKIVGSINYFGNISQTNNINHLGKRKNIDVPIKVKKNRKVFQFSKPLSDQILVINKPRITEKEASLIESTFEICIATTPSTPTSTIIKEEYRRNLNDQDANKCLEQLPRLHKFLLQAISEEYASFLKTVMYYEVNNIPNNEAMAIKLLKYIFIDYNANCEKPAYYTQANERTPYCEYVIPLFKYFSAVYKSLTFMWCEKGLEANKQLAVCLDDEQKKLMDGIGFSVKDKAERVVIECSGEVDGDHTEEDTLKLMEATSRCLKSEMGRYQSSSWSTFGDRKVLAIQVVNSTITLLSTKRVEGNKWAFIEQRSASIPRDWEDRMYWTKVIELLMKLNELLTEQEVITRKLKLEHVGLIKVNPEDTIKSRLNGTAN